MRKVLHNFSIEYLQVLDENGVCDESLKPPLSDDDVKKMYEAMVFARVFDETLLKLQREGRMYTFASLRGQEASQIGPAYALSADDWLVPSYRESGANLLKGTPPEVLYVYFAGDERGNSIPSPVKHLPVAVPVGTQTLHAVGIAWAAKMRGEKSAVLSFCGDGATSKGDFHEALNFAGVYKTPNVFMVINNGWAISLPRSKQTAAETLAQKAIAYGLRGIQVDGNDVFATYSAVKEALEFAYRGVPSVIECVTYRMSDHTTSDDAKKYRDPEEVELWRKRDPIDRLKKYMYAKGIMNKEYEEKVQQNSEKRISEAVKKAEAIQEQEPIDLFKYVYADMPLRLKEQYEELMS
ncbi:MAG: pyruvate dehydrogenase (acetyl-transferring) E1 component subunit alpha [Firmicutes bacterium]|nr:pyruvate dehydrogenase (acetyl-transferring) E1 component subunit alpha [Bacillota bacterium]